MARLTERTAHPTPLPHLNDHARALPKDLYGELLMLDLDIDAHAESCADAAAKGLSAPVGSTNSGSAVKTLQDEHTWFSRTRLTIRSLNNLGPGRCCIRPCLNDWTSRPTLLRIACET